MLTWKLRATACDQSSRNPPHEQRSNLQGWGGGTWLKAVALAVVRATNKAHELAHRVAVEVRRPERVLRDYPARREDNKVGGGDARQRGGARQHGEDGGVRMVKADKAGGAEAAEGVLEGHVVAMPSHHVKRRVILRVRGGLVQCDVAARLKLVIGVFE